MNPNLPASRPSCRVRMLRWVYFFVGSLFLRIVGTSAFADTLEFPIPGAMPAHMVAVTGLPSGSALSPPTGTAVTITVPAPPGGTAGPDQTVRWPAYAVTISGLPAGTIIAPPSDVAATGATPATTIISVASGQTADIGGVCYAHLGINCSLGLGEILLHREDIRSSIVQDNVIRITEQHKREASAWASVILPICGDSGDPQNPYSLGSWHCGASSRLVFGWWVGFQFAANNGSLLQSYGTGAFLGRKVTNGTSAGIGIGYAWTQSTALADGYVANSAPPGGASGVLTKTVDNGGPVIMAMFNF